MAAQGEAEWLQFLNQHASELGLNPAEITVLHTKINNHLSINDFTILDAPELTSRLKECGLKKSSSRRRIVDTIKSIQKKQAYKDDNPASKDECVSPIYNTPQANIKSLSLSKAELSLFSKQIQIPSLSSCPNEYKECIIIKRLLLCLYQYTDSKNTNNYDAFYHFMDKHYKKKVYDDYFHLSKYHQHELDSIMQFVIESMKFIKCDLSICNFANRHFRVDTARTTKLDKENMKYNDIYIETMDSLHYYLLHLTETGMRLSNESDIDNKEEEQKEEHSSSEHFDPSFKRARDIINKCRIKTDRFTRISGNKFNVSVTDSEVKGDDTFLDAVYEELSTQNHDKLVQFVKEIIEANGYDTDSLDLDLEIYIQDKNSNLSQLLGDQKDIHAKLVKVLQSYKCYVFASLIHILDSGSFSVGIDWEYETKNKHGRRKVPPEFLVKPRYKDLKTEMRNYKHMPYGEVKNIMTKAEEYSNTEIAKSVQKWTNLWRKGSLQLEHLISIIMYTDYTELSRDFTISFRKSHKFQLLKQINKHNSMYYHWSKTLRELIKGYGQRSDKGNGHLSELTGPFHCGMSVVLSVPQLSMFIHGPLSTSIHLEVALKFGGQAGMVLELDNSKGNGQDLRAMDVSWISRYREEEERVFFGCCHDSRDKLGVNNQPKPIIVSSIRLIETAANYQNTMKRITAFDNIISHNYGALADISESLEIGKILKAALDDTIQNEKDSFIYKTIQLLLNKKTEIEIDIYELNEASPIAVCDVFVASRKELVNTKQDNYVIPSDNTNIFRFDYFGNLEKLVVNGSQNLNIYWAFSFKCLLHLLTPNMKYIEISASTNTANKSSSWLSYVWNKQSTLLQDLYAAKGFCIDFERKQQGNYHTILIKKCYSVPTPAIQSSHYDGNNHKAVIKCEWKLPQSVKDSRNGNRKIRVAYRNTGEKVDENKWITKDINIDSTSESGNVRIGIQHGGDYDFKIRQYHDSIYSPYSNVKSITIPNRYIIPYTSLKLEHDAQNQNTIKVKWKILRSRDGHQYIAYNGKVRIEYKMADEENWISIDIEDATDNEHIIKVSKIGVYVVRIKEIVDDTLWSPWLSTKYISTDIPEIVSLQYDDQLQNGIIDVGWKRHGRKMYGSDQRIRIKYIMINGGVRNNDHQINWITRDFTTGKASEGIDCIFIDSNGVYIFKLQSIIDSSGKTVVSSYSNIKSIKIRRVSLER